MTFWSSLHKIMMENTLLAGSKKEVLIRFILVLFCIVLGVALNRIELPLITNFPILLGYIGSAFICLVYGYRYGVVAYFVIPLLSLPHELAWIAISVGLVEGALILIAKRLRISIVAVIAGYWMTVVALFVFAIYFLVYDQTFLLSQEQYIRFSTSGVLSIIFAYLAARLAANLPVSQKTPLPRASFSSIISSFVLSFVLLTSLLTSYVWIRTLESQERKQFSEQLGLVADNLANSIDESITQHLNVLEHLANIMQTDDEQTRWNESFDLTIANFPLFLTMLKTDRNGILSHAGPAFAREALPLDQALNIADRDYFKVPRDTGRSYISDVFRGRGFGDDLVVALSVPLFDNNGFAGVIEGSLDLSDIQRETQNILPKNTHFLLIDNNRNVVFTSIEVNLSFGDSIQFSSLQRFLDKEKTDYEFYISDAGNPYLIQERNLPNLSWPIIVGKETEELELKLIQILQNTHLFMLFSLFLSALIALMLGRGIAAPIKRVTERVTDETRFISYAESHEPVNSAVEEVNVLDETLIKLAQRLGKTITQLKTTLEINRRLNAELSRTNASLEYKVNERTAQLEESLKIAEDATLTKERFIANLSHEIKTPLNGILGMTNYLLNTDLPAHIREKIETVNDSGNLLAEFLEQVLQLSSMQQLGSHHLREVSFSELIESCVAPYRDELDSLNIEILVNIKLDFFLLLNPIGVRHVISNLLVNALKYSKATQITINAYEDKAHRLLIEFGDNGIGIPSQEQERLFKPYSQFTASTQSSNGLGLYISHQLCEAMQGTLTFEENYPSGSIFILNLPLVLALKPQSQQCKIVHSTSPLFDCAFEVAIVDDLGTNLKVAIAILSLLGIKATGFCNHIDLKETLAKRSFDLLFIDLFLRQEDGLFVARELCEEKLFRPEQIILITAADLSKKQQDDAFKYTAGVVKKPISVEKIKSVLRKTLPLD